jgi:beta-aspartyl-peptidase (threonine type)
MTQPTGNFALALHGGAGTEFARFDSPETQAMERSLAQILAAGETMLRDGALALDVVEHVVRLLEDDPQFNAGVGSAFNAVGGHELDASIMDGRTRACGAVGCLTTVKNPIHLARLVMERTPHILLIGDGAEKFADDMQVERVPNSYFSTPTARDRFDRSQAAKRANPGDKIGTVGCVALDRAGNLAAATSTGGMTNKAFGRIGDSPLIGAGTFADNASCAVSCTGTGEHFIRNAVAYDLHARMAYLGQSLAEAADMVLHQVLPAGAGGLIAVDHLGNVVTDYTTPGMARAAIDGSGKRWVQLVR